MAIDLRAVLAALSGAPGVGGLAAAPQAAASYLRELGCEVEQDPLGSVTGWRRCGRENAPVLMLEAHIDEVGLIVTGVDDGGFVRVSACGGTDRRALIAAEVIVHGDKEYPGVFCAIPPHLSGPDSEGKIPAVEELGIDIGLDAKRARRHVREGDRVSFRPNFCALAGERVSGKSLDDRAGVAAVLRCLDLLADKELECDIAAVFAVQEELGCRGSSAASYRIAPSAAIAVDVSFAYTPDADRAKCGELAGGPMIGWAPGLDDRMTRRLLALAEQAGIPCQNEVMGGDTGTDADSIADARGGVRTALLSVPLRYMHTPAEVIDLRDVENTARLMAEFAEKEGEAL
ncbi:MAG TPA: M20/M25/M40 family metallo-hydrolase [Firmicutes bacterium]|nr:M20/M25/M40 family metallo-hydrolase [Bacillota bacterium]